MKRELGMPWLPGQVVALDKPVDGLDLAAACYVYVWRDGATLLLRRAEVDRDEIEAAGGMLRVHVDFAEVFRVVEVFNFLMRMSPHSACRSCHEFGVMRVMKAPSRFLRLWFGSLALLFAGTSLRASAELAFFTCSDTYYNQAAVTNAAQAAMIDMINALPGKSYPDEVGGGTVAARLSAALLTGPHLYSVAPVHVRSTHLVYKHDILSL